VLNDYDFAIWKSEIVVSDSAPEGLLAALRRLLGLSHENIVMDQFSYDIDTQLLTARVRLYDSKSNALAAGAAGLIATYTVTETWAGINKLTKFTQVLEP
jgi:hypothetical protein